MSSFVENGTIVGIIKLAILTLLDGGKTKV